MTVPEVFILESLDLEDERSGRFEGRALADILRAAGKNPKYLYLQSRAELPHAVALFRESDYRYLHISVHATKGKIALTHGSLGYRAFADALDNSLNDRRLFVSACSAGNDQLAGALAARSPLLRSLVAPAESVDMHLTLPFWAALYLSLFARNQRSISHYELSMRLTYLKALFPFDVYHAWRAQGQLRSHVLNHELPSMLLSPSLKGKATKANR